MTREGLRISMKGFVMDLNGIRKMEQEKAITSIGYQIAKTAFELLNEEVKKSPFKDKYEVDIYDDKIEKSDLEKIVDLVTLHTDDVNEELNKNIQVEGVKRVSVGVAYNGNILGVKVRIYFND